MPRCFPESDDTRYDERPLDAEDELALARAVAEAQRSRWRSLIDEPSELLRVMAEMLED